MLAYFYRFLSYIKLIIPHSVLEHFWAHLWTQHLFQWRALNLFNLIVFDYVLLEAFYDFLLLLFDLWKDVLIDNSWYFCSWFTSIFSWSSLFRSVFRCRLDCSNGFTALSYWWFKFFFGLFEIFLVIIKLIKILAKFRFFWTQFLFSSFFSWWLLLLVFLLCN